MVTSMIDKNVITPLYVQVANELRKEILSNQYGQNGCIGTHNQLVDRFGVSLITIRKAVQILEEEGIVEILQGKGTFVRRTSLVDPLQDLTGISNMMSDMRMENQVTVPVFELRDTPLWIDRDIRSALGEKSLFIRRVVSVGDVPAANADMYLPGKFFPMFTKSEVEDSTIYQIYSNKLGIVLGRGKQIIRAAGATGEVAESLGLAENSPVLQIVRRAYDDQKNLIEYMILTYEASKYCFEVELELSKARGWSVPEKEDY